MIEGEGKGEMDDYIIIAKGIKHYFPVKESFLSRSKASLRAVDDVDLFIKRGEVVGLVGESGCGKTTFGMILVDLLTPTDGTVFLDLPGGMANALSTGGQISEEGLRKFAIHSLSRKSKKKLRKEIQIVFQDPYSSLDPRYLVKDIIAEPLFSFGESKQEAYKLVGDTLSEVGLSEVFMNRFPHQLSGGQRQRVAIARAIVQNPKFIVLDEPTSALDVSVQAQVLNVLRDLKEKHNLTMLFISHHLMVIRHICDRVVVMYLGKVVEIAETEALFSTPLHPYSMALISAIPVPDVVQQRERIILAGEVPSPIHPPKGCRFHTRCKYAFEKCGWSAGEVIEGIEPVFDRSVNDELSDFPNVLSTETMDNDDIRIRFDKPLDNSQVDIIRSLINRVKEKKNVRSLYGIKALATSGSDLILSLYQEVIEPPLREAGKGHFVSCWLLDDPGYMQRNR